MALSAFVPGAGSKANQAAEPKRARPDRPAHAPTFTREHGPQPGEHRDGPLDETERLREAPPEHEPSAPDYRPPSSPSVER
jgi:hypothetical protein